MNADMVIQKLKSIGYQIRMDGREILLTADCDPDPAIATVLLLELKRCKPEAVRILNWTADEKTLIDQFLISPTHEAPFNLNACTRVINSEVFYAALRRDIEAGPRGTRARYGALQCDLQDLHNLH